MSRTSSAATSPAPLARRYPTNAQRHGQNSRSLPTNDSAVPPLRSVSVDGYSSDSDYDELDKRRARQLERANTLSKEYVEDEETAVLKKLDKRLTLFLAFLYLLSFLDRSNIGNARIAGLEKTLQLSDREFDYCLVAFYVTYIAFEWMILLYSIIPPHIYISLCVLAWGIVASLQSVVSSFGQLLALRGDLLETQKCDVRLTLDSNTRNHRSCIWSWSMFLECRKSCQFTDCIRYHSICPSSTADPN